jgi:hypothetical protein
MSHYIDKAVHFFTGFGVVLTEVFLLMVILALFYFIIPRGYGKLLKITVAFGCVRYLAEWLAAK